MVVSLLLALLLLTLGQYRYIRLQQKRTERLLAELKSSQKKVRKGLKAQIKSLHSQVKRFEASFAALGPGLVSIESNLGRIHHELAAVSQVQTAPVQPAAPAEPALAALLAPQLIQWLASKGARVLRNTNPVRIGHFTGETDLWTKERILLGKDIQNCIIIGDASSVANPHLWSYWSEYFNFTISPPTWDRLLASYPDLKKLEDYPLEHFLALNETAKCYEIYAKWGDRPPLLKLREDDRTHLSEVLRGWGLKDADWFVCIHNRERGYSTVDDEIHDYRNASINAYIPAMQEIVARGGWVIRMGDTAMTPLPEMERVVDYANLPERSARLDVLLCAAAKFFIGTSSGLFVVSTTFGVPVASANFVPMSALQFTPRDIGMPMLHEDSSGRLLTFPEIMTSDVANFRDSTQYQEKGIRVLNNTPEEILGLVAEMLDRVLGICEYTEDDELLQGKFRSLLKPGHYGYGAAARTSRDFLRKHRALLMTS